MKIARSRMEAGEDLTTSGTIARVMDALVQFGQRDDADRQTCRPELLELAGNASTPWKWSMTQSVSTTYARLTT